MSNDPNDRQVGGSHYKHAGGFQHWDLMSLADAGYFAGQVTKYTERHSRKNGREDLEKALHFAEKWLTVYQAKKTPFVIGVTIGRRGPDQAAVAEAVRDYAVDNNLTAMQERIFEHCLRLDGDVEEVVRLCRTHLVRVYGELELAELADSPPEPPASGAPEEFRIPTFLMGDASSPGTPEDGGHHAAFVDAVESALTADLSDFTGGVVAVEDDGSVTRAPEVAVDFAEPGKASKRRGKV